MSVTLQTMLETAIAYVQTLIQTYGASGVFAATLIEEIVAPIPSALVPLAAGFSLLTPDILITEALFRAALLVALPVMFGIAIGSSVVYSIAHFGGKPVIDRYGKLLGTSWNEIEQMRTKFTGGRVDEAVLFGLRLVPVIPGVAISAVAGVIRYPFKVFLGITLIASFLRAYILALIGWQVGELYMESLHTIEKYESYVLIALALIAGYTLARWVYKKYYRP